MMSFHVYLLLLLIISAIALSEDSGVCKTYPLQCSTLLTNGYVMINGRPCKIVELSTTENDATVNIVANDIFTGTKLMDSCPSANNIDIPDVTSTPYNLVDLNDGICSLLGIDASTKDNVPLPNGSLGDDIKAAFDNHSDVSVTVLAACGEEAIVSYSARTN